MAGMVIDVSGVTANLGQFPNGVYEARVTAAKLDIAQSSGEPVIKLEWEIYHPELGNATIRDTLPSKFPAKCKAFYQAVSDLSHEDMQDPSHQQIELDPDELIGAECLVQLGEREGTANDGSKRMYKSIVGSWYFPSSRQDLIGYEDTPF